MYFSKKMLLNKIATHLEEDTYFLLLIEIIKNIKNSSWHATTLSEIFFPIREFNIFTSSWYKRLKPQSYPGLWISRMHTTINKMTKKWCHVMLITSFEMRTTFSPSPRWSSSSRFWCSESPSIPLEREIKQG